MSVNRTRRKSVATSIAIGLGIVALSSLFPFTQTIGKPGAGGPPTASASPDIVYLSASSQAAFNVEVRGVTMNFSSGGALSSTDSSLLKSSNSRSLGGIAWSPDGKRFAWIENGSILTASPGGKPTILYPTQPGDPKALGNSDALAWGADCSGAGDSVVTFLSELPSYSVQALTVKAGAVVRREALLPLESTCDANNVCTAAGGAAFAFSPAGQLLAFAGFSSSMASGVWVVPLCEVGHYPSMILSHASLGGTDWFPATSIDWSPDGKRLAFSVITGPDPDYPWRDLKIADLNYNNTFGTDTVSAGTVRSTSLGSSFGSASSEHSPQWDPSTTGTACERIAFSQSSDSGRAMYVADLKGGAGCSTELRLINARNPRALDWRAK
jgi:hypothetical protein